MGIDYHWDKTPKMNALFIAGQAVITQYLPAVLQEEAAYRQRQIKIHSDKNSILSDGFWYFLLNKDDVTRQFVEWHINTRETSPALKSLLPGGVNQNGLNYLYMRMSAIKRSPLAAFWYVFWDDFWSENKEMSVLEDFEEYFNPSKAKALCYYIMERPSLEKFLSEKGLLGGCIKELFSARMLDALYKKVDELRPYASNLVSNTVNEKGEMMIAMVLKDESIEGGVKKQEGDEEKQEKTTFA